MLHKGYNTENKIVISLQLGDLGLNKYRLMRKYKIFLSKTFLVQGSLFFNISNERVEMNFVGLKNVKFPIYKPKHAL